MADQTVKDANLAVSLTLNQYKAGIVAYTAVVTAQATALTRRAVAPEHPPEPPGRQRDPHPGPRRRLEHAGPVRGARGTADAALRPGASGARMQVLVDAARERRADAAHLRQIGDAGAHHALQPAEVLQQRAALGRP